MTETLAAESLSIDASEWINGAPITFDSATKKIYVVYVFQMLCAPCVYYGLPAMRKVCQTYLPEEVEVIGVHSVFENHAAMTVDCLKVFVKEFRVPFTVSVDRHSDGSRVPNTMLRYGWQGTPTFLIVNGKGEILYQKFGSTPGFDFDVMIHKYIRKSN